MPYTKIAIHLVWSTKNRENLINHEIKSKLIRHIKENAERKEIVLSALNCVADHIHLLIFLKPDQKLSDIVRLVKGESSHWVNKNKLTKTKFRWQEEYFANSVSESNIEKVKVYIANQHKHHKNKMFIDEYIEFRRKHGFD